MSAHLASARLNPSINCELPRVLAFCAGLVVLSPDWRNNLIIADFFGPPETPWYEESSGIVLLPV
ncbi:MAG: hypothetical protein V2G51_02370 [bacterium JZ-2024 1]